MLPFLYFCFFFFSFLFLFLWRCILLYYRQKVKQTIWTFWSSETQGQSVGPGEKAQWTFSSTGGRAPGYRLSPDHFQTVKQILAPDWAQNGFVSLCPILEQHLLSFFCDFVHDGYWLDHGLSGSCTKEMHTFRKLLFWYKLSISKYCLPKTEDAFSKIQAWAYNGYPRLHRSHLRKY